SQKKQAGGCSCISKYLFFTSQVLRMRLLGESCG
ncbi:MAG: hypothetical protein ACI9KI_001423, partial [Patiriisocius sp.]